jgi:hypothetical protein
MERVGKRQGFIVQRIHVAAKTTTSVPAPPAQSQPPRYAPNWAGYIYRLI